MIRPTRPLVPQLPTRHLLLAQLGAVVVAVATCVGGSARADDVADLIAFQANTPAVADDVNQNFDDLKTAVNSKSTSGFDFTSSDASLAIAPTAATPTVVSSLTLTAPGAGFAFVDFSAYLAISHTQGAGSSFAVCALKTDANNPETATGRIPGSRRFVPVLSEESTGTHYPHVTTSGVLPVAAAGSVTINVVCYRSSSSNSATMIYRTLAVSFHEDRL